MAGPRHDSRWLTAPSLGALIVPLALAARPIHKPAPPPQVPAPERPAALSQSLGRSYDGRLLRGRELPVRGHGYFTLYKDRRWGTDELVGGVLSVASRLHRTGLPPLSVGSLSRRGGGKLGGHRSHQNGRDLDVGFYMLTPEGTAITSPRFVDFNAAGRGRLHGMPVRFDVRRNWLLIRTLLTEKQLDLRYVFVARHIKLKLIAHALSRGEPEDLVRRAALLMREPRGDPHGHHFHLRVGCSSEDLSAGCRDL